MWGWPQYQLASSNNKCCGLSLSLEMCHQAPLDWLGNINNFCLCWCFSPWVNNFSVMSGQFPVFLGWTSTKQRINHLRKPRVQSPLRSLCTCVRNKVDLVPLACTCLRNRVDLVPLACEDEDKLAQGHIRVPPVSLDTHNPSTPKSNALPTEPLRSSNIYVSGQMYLWTRWRVLYQKLCNKYSPLLLGKTNVLAIFQPLYWKGITLGIGHTTVKSECSPFVAYCVWGFDGKMKITELWKLGCCNKNKKRK